MEKENISKQVLEKIKDKKIKPKSKWEFLLKDYVWWFLGILALNIGGLAFSVIIYFLVNNDEINHIPKTTRNNSSYNGDNSKESLLK